LRFQPSRVVYTHRGVGWQTVPAQIRWLTPGWPVRTAGRVMRTPLPGGFMRKNSRKQQDRRSLQDTRDNTAIRSAGRSRLKARSIPGTIRNPHLTPRFRSLFGEASFDSRWGSGFSFSRGDEFPGIPAHTSSARRSGARSRGDCLVTGMLRRVVSQTARRQASASSGVRILSSAVRRASPSSIRLTSNNRC